MKGHEKLEDIIIAVCFFVFIIAVIYIFAGCATRSVVIATDESILASQASVANIEASNERLRDLLRLNDEFFTATTQYYDEFIRESIRLAEQGNLDAFTALDRYDEFVSGLIARIRQLELAISAGAGTGKPP